ncbi:MAG TPA: hypothetical protein VGQ37_25090 [Vicinamibacterales bacterium]|jgi:hypothetical protein|nr:hypothetical protein [Vicinamibacterales bacterium]
MTADERPDDVLRLLERLSTPAPRAPRSDGTRARCHAAMARRARHRSVRILDAVLGVAVALYGVAVVAEGLRVLFR